MPSDLPFERVTKSHLERLCNVLWSWQFCNACSNGTCCPSEECPFKRSGRLKPYFDYYKEVTANFQYNTTSSQDPNLRSHEILFGLIRNLKGDPRQTRKQLRDKFFAHRPRRDEFEEQKIVDLAVEIILMVDCSVGYFSTIPTVGPYRALWREDTPFEEFVNDLFPTTDHPRFNDEDVEQGRDIKQYLLARKLKKHAGLKFLPTDDLRCHLKLDKRSGVVQIFHHTAFLKEHLRLTRDKPNLSLSQSLQLGALPRQLALEALDSLQKILFPHGDDKSFTFLNSLTSTQGFDPDCIRYDGSATIRTAEEKNIRYHYFGNRLADLYEELQNPTPRGFEKWFERKSGARYVMMATLAGVIFAILLGIASLAVSSYQAWIGYQQWQHPVSTGGG